MKYPPVLFHSPLYRSFIIVLKNFYMSTDLKPGDVLLSGGLLLLGGYGGLYSLISRQRLIKYIRICLYMRKFYEKISKQRNG